MELFVINFSFAVLCMFVIDLIVTKVGMALADRQVLLSGSTQILDNLDEGLVILDQSNNDQVLYHNAAAF